MESSSPPTFITDKKIISTDSLDVIESELYNEETLLILDCDDVIIRRTDAVFAPVNKDVHQQMWDYLKSKVEAEKFEELCLNVRKQASVELLDDGWPVLISNLQKKNVKIILHTAHRTGSFCGETCVEDLRISELLKFGMNFSKS